MADENNGELERAKERFKSAYDRIPVIQRKLQELDESWRSGISRPESLSLFKRELQDTITWIQEDYDRYVRDV